MRFGKRLQCEAGDDWVAHYIAYTMLKRLMDKCVAAPDDKELRQTFLKELQNNAAKINSHFIDVLREVREMHGECVRVTVVTTPDETTPLRVDIPGKTQSPIRDRTTGNSLFLMCIGERLFQRQSPLQQKFRKAYRLAMRLSRFADINREGIRKVIKKYDKNMGTKESDAILKAADKLDFVVSRAEVQRLVEDITKEFQTTFNEPLHKYGEAEINSGGQWHVKWHNVVISFLFMAVVNIIPILSDHQDAHRCLAMITCILTLWLTEAIPFFCTAMFIPLLAVWLNVISDANNVPLSPVDSAQLLLAGVFGHTQVLVLGGLVMAKAIAKHKLETRVAHLLHALVGHRPSLYMLGIMFMGLFMSAFVSNIATPVLLLSVIQHTLWDMPPASGAPHAILLGLAISCNFGGMMTPISSPQNAVALQVLSTSNMHITFYTWLMLAAPIGIIGVIVSWALLLLIWNPFKELKFIPSPLMEKEKLESDPREMWLVIAVCVATITLWVVQPLSDAYFGDAAMVALFPIVVFFGLGVLSKDDFNTLSWHLLFLLSGGSMLGLCARHSHLIDTLMTALKPSLLASSPQMITVGIILSVAFITSFISHTVGAMILLPVVLEIANVNAAVLSPPTLIFGAVVMVSGAMAFPITSFPNVNSLLAEDDVGRPYLLAKHFLVPGMTMTLFVLVTLLTVMGPYMTYMLGK